MADNYNSDVKKIRTVTQTPTRQNAQQPNAQIFEISSVTLLKAP